MRRTLRRHPAVGRLCAVPVGARAAMLALCAATVACEIPLPPVDSPDASDADAAPPTLDEILANNVCGDLSTEDLGCGGLPVGAWEIVRSCPAVGLWDPLDGTCPERTSAGVGEVAGTLRFGADGSYRISLSAAELELGFSFPLSCYGGATSPCRGENFAGVCEVIGERCACDVTKRDPARAVAGNWFVSGGSMQLSAGDQIYAAAICRAGEHVLRLTLFSNDPAEVSWILIARRTVGVSSEAAP